MTEDEIAAMRTRDAMLDQLKRLRPHGLRLTPQNLIVAAELVRFDQAALAVAESTTENRSLLSPALSGVFAYNHISGDLLRRKKCKRYVASAHVISFGPQQNQGI